MSKQSKGVPFSEVFESYIKEETLPVGFDAAKVKQIQVDRDSGILSVRTSFSGFVDIEAIQSMESQIGAGLSVTARIDPRYPAESLCGECFPTLLTLLCRSTPTANGTMNGAVCHVEDDIMRITLTHGGKDMLHTTKTDKALVSLVRKLFGRRVELVFDGVTEVDTDSEEYRRMMEDAEREASLLAQEAAREAAKNNPPPSNGKGETLRRRKAADPSKPPSDGLPIYLETAQNLFGSPIRERPAALSTLEPDGGEYTVWGKIFDMDVRAFRDGASLRYTYKLTDHTNSVAAIFWMNTRRDKAKIDMLENVREGDCVLLSGSYEFDRFANDNVFNPKSMALVAPYVRQDTAETKRVELHLHTKMSSMDAVSNVQDLVLRAAEWGHKAIAITDHGVVQAFPDAMEAAQKAKKQGQDIKVLYGMEAYYVNDGVGAVKGDIVQPLNGSFIVFDIETTGLSAQNDRITEIGAVRVEDGQVVEEFSTFVNPEMPISAKITELTGITDQMVKDAPKEQQALETFLAFCGDNQALVAHNAPFDTSFIRAAAKRSGIAYTFSSVDTATLCRALYPELKNHRLNTVAKHLGLADFNHHRALDDTRALAAIFFHLIEKLREERGVTAAEGINSALTGVDTKKARPNHMILLARNKIGLKNLYKLISWSHLHNFYRRPRITKSKLEEHREGLIIGSACEQGELFQGIMEGRPWRELCDLARFYDF